MLLPKINIPNDFINKIPLKDTAASLQRLNISPFALTTVALAANEELVCPNNILSLSPTNILPLFKKSLSLIKEHINSFNSPLISLNLAMKKPNDQVEFDEVKVSLGMYFTATINEYLSIDFTLKNPCASSKSKRFQKILSLLAQRMAWLVPSQSALTMNDSTMECDIFQRYHIKCKKLKISVSAENFLRLYPNNELGIDTIDVANKFVSGQSWYNNKRTLISKKKISREIRKLNSTQLTDCLTQIHNELESVIIKFQRHCRNNFGYGDETLTHDKGLYIYGGFPDEVLMIDDEINMMNQLCEPIEDIFYPNYSKGLTHALEYYQAIQKFCINTAKTLKPHQ